MITINFDSKTKTITIDTKAKLDNGGAGSGYWGHAGRPGKVGGSAEDKSGKKISKKKKIDQKQQHRIERADYGKRLRELSEVFGGTNVGGDYKEKYEKAQKEKQKENRKIKDLKKEVKKEKIKEDKQKEEVKKVKKEEKKEEPKKEEDKKTEKLREYRDKVIKQATGYDGANDESDEPFKEMKKAMFRRYPEAFEDLQEEVFKTPDNINNILANDNTAFFTANYWQSPNGEKQRIYFNVENTGGYKYDLEKDYIEL